METAAAPPPPAPGALQARIGALQRHVQARPDDAPAWAELAKLLLEAGQWQQVLSAAGEALRLRPDLPDPLEQRAQAHLLLSRWADAEADYRRFLAGRGAAPFARLNLGQAMLRQGRTDEALALTREVLARNPQLPEAHQGLALVQEERGALAEALAACDATLRLQPERGEWYFRRAGVLMRLLRVEDARADYRRGLELLPDSPRMRSSYLYTFLYTEEPLERVFAEHREWARVHAARLPRPAAYPNGRDPERLLQVGLVAPTFSAHAGGIAGRGLIEHFDPRRMAVTCYSDVTEPDHLTRHYRARATRWRDVAALDDEHLAAQVRADGIDILVDRSGHAANHRLGLFARRPAPVQVTWLEYMNTTGLDAIDYWLSDPLATPLSLQPFYAETIWHMEPCMAMYSPPPDCPAVPPLPAAANGHVTFAVFNNPLKIHTRCLRLLVRVLQALPGSRLHFKYAAWEAQDAVARMTASFAAHGIGPQRLAFSGRSTRQAYLEAFGAKDIALDTFPHNGLITTLESLWMGVPVVTLRGEPTVSRVGYSLLTTLGHPEWAVTSEDDYVAAALRLATDLPTLATLRAGLRQRMAASPLRDGPGHARALEAAFRGMWRRWCGSP